MHMKTKPAENRVSSALERRRLKAAGLLRRGRSPAEVARRLGVHRQSVGGWQQHLDREGLAGLKKAGRAGRPAKMRVEQLLRLEEELARGPRAWGYTTELWTPQREADLIQRRFRAR